MIIFKFYESEVYDPTKAHTKPLPSLHAQTFREAVGSHTDIAKRTNGRSGCEIGFIEQINTLIKQISKKILKIIKVGFSLLEKIET